MEFGLLANDLITLKPLTAVDFEALYTVAADPEIWKQHPDFNRYTKEGFTDYFNKLLLTDEPYLIIRNEDKVIIGATSYYEKENLKKTIAIGYTFLIKSCWGGFYNSSIKRLMIDTAFTFYDEIVFHVRERNFRSQAALVKIGAVKTREYPSAFDPSSLQLDFVLYKD